MTIQTTAEGDKTTLAITGRLDTNTAPQLEAALKEVGPGVKLLVLDLAGMPYISSAGLRAVLVAQKKMAAQGELQLVNTGEAVMEIFDTTGFTDIIHFA